MRANGEPVGAPNFGCSYVVRMTPRPYPLVFVLLASPAFASVDPVTADPETGSYFNRYAYANNAPFSWIDPDGRRGLHPYPQCESAPVLPTGGPPIAVLPTESGIVTAPFGLRRHPLTGLTTLHNGTDFRARQEAQVRSTQNGQVRAITSGGTGGNQILVENHDGSLSGYAHVAAEASVTQGAAVTLGQVIGRSDGSGRVTAPHLHYTYRPGTVREPATPSTPTVDPMRSQLKRYVEEAK